jgi:hypothetical protein
MADRCGIKASDVSLFCTKDASIAWPFNGTAFQLAIATHSIIEQMRVLRILENTAALTTGIQQCLRRKHRGCADEVEDNKVDMSAGVDSSVSSHPECELLLPWLFPRGSVVLHMGNKVERFPMLLPQPQQEELTALLFEQEVTQSDGFYAVDRCLASADQSANTLVAVVHQPVDMFRILFICLALGIAATLLAWAVCAYLLGRSESKFIIDTLEVTPSSSYPAPMVRNTVSNTSWRTRASSQWSKSVEFLWSGSTGNHREDVELYNSELVRQQVLVRQAIDRRAAIAAIDSGGRALPELLPTRPFRGGGSPLRGGGSNSYANGANVYASQNTGTFFTTDRASGGDAGGAGAPEPQRNSVGSWGPASGEPLGAWAYSPSQGASGSGV